MKKPFLAMISAALLLTCTAACDSSNGSEPDAPIESGNPTDTISTDTVPTVIPPEPKPLDFDSIILPEDIQLVEYTPYSGPVEPLSDQIQPLLTDGKKWTCISVENSQKENNWAGRIVIGSKEVNGIEHKVVAPILYDHEFFRKTYLERDGVVYESVPGRGYLPIFNVNPTDSHTFDFTLSHPSYELTIISRGKMTVRGKERRAVKLWTGPYSVKARYDYWVEGIGSLLNAYAGYNVFYPTTPPGRVAYEVLVQCVDGNGELIYDYRDFDSDLYEEIEVFTDIDKQFYDAQQP